ncbi:MAG: CpsD/CapB family tyrosine-protein kinase [Lachnospiraceae bacterium]|nr:CpsD/CapB family tyrosine-protein kinase [Lachnospiraceae bacterium]
MEHDIKAAKGEGDEPKKPIKIEKIDFLNEHKVSYAMRESLRALRTNLQFCGDDVKVILFTSCAPNEGKSTVAYDLAKSINESGKSVMLIDADMRKSVLIGRLRAKTRSGEPIYGLSHFLSGQKKLSEVIYRTPYRKFYMIFAGPSVPNPTEILDKKYFGDLVEFAKSRVDYVLIDCAPLGAAIDSAVIARHCDGAVIVVAQGKISCRAIADAKRQLEASGVRILGAVLNKVKEKHRRYKKYYGNYYGDYYNNEDGKKKK